MYSWLNVGSLLLGLTALVIPVIIIVRYKKTGTETSRFYMERVCVPVPCPCFFRYATVIIWSKLRTGQHFLIPRRR